MRTSERAHGPEPVATSPHPATVRDSIMGFRRLALLATFLGLATGCTLSRPGLVMQLPSGPSFPVTVKVGADSATVTGEDPATGEVFEGTFKLEPRVRKETERGIFGPAQPVGGGAVTPGMAPSQSLPSPATVEMSGILEGDKGTSLKCVLEVKQRLRVGGSGLCRPAGTPDADPTHRLTF